jgi:hypothetical protein
VGHVDRLLEILAVVRPCRDRPFEALARLVRQRQAALSGVICVLLEWDAARCRLVNELQGLGVPTLVLLVTGAPPGPAVVAAPADLEAAGVHHLQVGHIAEGLAQLS